MLSNGQRRVPSKKGESGRQAEMKEAGLALVQ